jgi:8-oxo-dGTP diphosphatase
MENLTRAMKKYAQQTRILSAVDCIVFGYDGEELKLLVIQRGFEPFKGHWSLVGGFIQGDESAEDAASRVLRKLTGLDGVYMEQLHTFSKPDRDSVERTVSISFFSLIDIQQYKQQMSEDYHAAWFPINHFPDMIFDHKEMVELAKEKLRYKAALHPILFELLPAKFTIPQLQNLYECVYDVTFDKGNFSRKILSTSLLVKQKDKDKLNSKKGAFYYKLDVRKYKTNLNAFLNFVPNPHTLKNSK